MSKIAEKKAVEAYPKVLSPYYGDNILDRNVDCRAGYINGYDQAFQDFIEKAKEFFIEQHAGMFTQFKNYMQDESKD
jgi:hypothetical protein